jgi:hypothetical protein
MATKRVRRTISAALAAVALVAVAAWVARGPVMSAVASSRERLRSVMARFPGAPPTRDSGTVVDPLSKLPAQVRGPRAEGSAAIAGIPTRKDWVTAPISGERARSRSAKQRGVDPCNTPDPGLRGFRPWRRISATGQVMTPERGALREDGTFDLVIHFHGHELARKEFVRAATPLVLLGISRRQGIGYNEIAGGSESLSNLVAAVEQVVGEQEHRPARARHLALTAWSGGYEPIGMVLKHDHAGRVEGVALLDGLHASRDLTVARGQLAPFTDYARRAAAGRLFLFVTYSSIEPGGYASTTRTAHQLIDAVGGAPLLVARDEQLGMELVEMFSLGDFHTRGYIGGREPDHCAHLSLLPLALRVLHARWQAAR